MCSQAYVGDRCPNCGARPMSSTRQSPKYLRPYLLLQFAGFVVCFCAAWACGFLDCNYLMTGAWVLLLIGQIAYRVWPSRGGSSSESRPANTFCKLWALVALAFASFLLADRYLDKSPAQLVRVTVVRKSERRSARGGTAYILEVAPSWRSGRDAESLYVDGITFGGIRLGEDVTISVHKGLVGVPWYEEPGSH
jgi:hypothetical protein